MFFYENNQDEIIKDVKNKKSAKIFLIFALPAVIKLYQSVIKSYPEKFSKYILTGFKNNFYSSFFTSTEASSNVTSS